MKTLACLLGLVLLVLIAPIAGAQKSDTEDYLLGADDVLDITVVNHIDLMRTVTILPDGTISFPEVGDIKAAGKTPKALAAEIQAGLEKTRNQAFVVVSVKEIKSRRIRVTGAVKTSGTIELKRKFRLMDAIATAGGLTVKSTRVLGRLFRDGEKVITLDIAKAVSNPDSDANPVLKNDDLILLDEVDIMKQVNILGQVLKPGPYDLTEGLNVVQLISQAGGPTERAWLKEAYILRGSTKIPVNLVPVLLKNQSDAAVTNLQLQLGDVLIIPETDDRFAVLGQVTKPGYFPMSEKQPTTVLEALSMAGGQTTEANLRGAGILRVVNGVAKPVAINIDEILKKGKLAKNVVLEKGDILVIPSRSRRDVGIQDFLGPISTLLSFGVLR